MERVMWIVKLALIGYSLCGYTAPAIADDTLDELNPDQIVSVRITLNPWGANLGFETEVNGDDPKVHLLVAVIGEAELSKGHKCANRGAIRFRMEGGGVISLGLLPGHTEGFYEFRLYEEGEYVAFFRIERSPFLEALAGLDVPVNGPAFEE